MHSIRRYVRGHWRGEHSLARAFWINFMLLFCILNLSQPLSGLIASRLTLPWMQSETVVTVVAVVFFLLVRVLIYGWQVVGVVRACERCIAERTYSTSRAWAFAAEGVVVLSLAVSLTAAFSGYQSLLAYRNSLKPPVAAEPDYSLEVVTGNHGKLIHLRGPLQVGVTHRVAQLLAGQPQVTGIILDSDGGQIYEGRGLARLIKEHGLATYSLRECISSCTTAFVAGRTRALGAGARLGFHQYKNYGVLPAADMDAEHAKDLAWFKAQGIAAGFVGKIFHQPPEAMWWPGADELLAAGVIHRIDFVLPGGG